MAGICILVSLSSARSVIWEDPTGNSIFDPYEFTLPPKDAIEAWENDKECFASYFELNQRNVNDSGVVNWFPKWMEKMRQKYPDEYSKKGEVRFFSDFAWGDPNFMCGMLKTGCKTVPTCKAIVERILVHRIGSNSSLADNLSEARRVFFMALEFQAMSEFMYYQWVTTLSPPFE